MATLTDSVELNNDAAAAGALWASFSLAALLSIFLKRLYSYGQEGDKCPGKYDRDTRELILPSAIPTV